MALNHPAMPLRAGGGLPDTSKSVGEPGLTIWETWKNAGTEVFLEDGRKPPEWNGYSLDEVYTLLESASSTHLFEPGGRLLRKADSGLHHLFVPGGDAMRRDVRFVKLCAQLGLCDYWVRTERWPDCADKLSLFYDFRSEARRHVA